MKRGLFSVSALLVVFSIAVPAIAAQLTSNFRDLDSPFLVTYTIGAIPTDNLTTLGPVKITNSRANT